MRPACGAEQARGGHGRPQSLQQSIGKRLDRDPQVGYIKSSFLFQMRYLHVTGVLRRALAPQQHKSNLAAGWASLLER
jgi:hypothetical protein